MCEVSACERETALEWALESLANALDEIVGKSLPEPERAIQAVIEILEQNLAAVRREADFERAQNGQIDALEDGF